MTSHASWNNYRNCCDLLHVPTEAVHRMIAAVKLRVRLQQATQSSLTTSAILRQETASRGHSACGKSAFDAYTKPAGACCRHLLTAYRSSAPVQCCTTSVSTATCHHPVQRWRLRRRMMSCHHQMTVTKKNDSSGARVRSRLIWWQWQLPVCSTA